MNLNKLILLLFNYYENRINGKTLIQKRMYFLSDHLKKDFGYYAHFYGPYSDDVNYALDLNCGLGFLEGDKFEYDFGHRRYEYKLTSDGQELLNFINEKEPTITQKVGEFSSNMKMAGDLDDYSILSYAAKLHFIFNHFGIIKELKKIKESASYYGWNLTPGQIKKGQNFLEKYTHSKNLIDDYALFE